jgi:hypothetical protein
MREMKILINCCELHLMFLCIESGWDYISLLSPVFVLCTCIIVYYILCCLLITLRLFYDYLSLLSFFSFLYPYTYTFKNNEETR